MVGVYTLSVSGNACPPDNITIIVKSVSSAPAVITGKDVICPNTVYQYKVDGIHDNSFFEWEITEGILYSTAGDSVAVMWTMEYGGTGLLSLYRVSREEPFCRKLINQMEVQYFNFNKIVIVESPNNNHYANCHQLFYVTYNGTIYPDGRMYNWRILPNEAGSVLEHDFLGYNPTVLYNHTTLQRTTDTLLLHFAECEMGSTHIKILTINPVPVPVVAPASIFVCAEVPLTFQIGNSTLYDNMSYRIADGAEHSISGNSFTASFQNNTTINQYVNVVITGYKCGTPYHTTMAIMVKPAPDIFITPNYLLKFCRDSSFNVSLTANAVIPISSNQWLYPDSTTLIADTCYATNFGTYRVTVTFNNGCTQGKDVSIITKSCGGNGNNPSCNVMLSKTIDCNQISFNLQSTTPLNYEWSSYPEGLVLVSGDSQAIFKATQAGYYTIEVWASCWQSSHNVAIPVVPACSLSFTCNSAQNGYIAHFYNTSSVLPGYTVSYEYLLDGNAVSSSMELPAGSIHTLIIRNRYNGIICDSDPLIFTVPTLPDAEFSTNFTPVCVLVPIIFTPLYSNDVTDYLWNFDVTGNKHGILLSSVGEHAYQFEDHESQSEHKYKVSLTVTDKYGCNNNQMDSEEVLDNSLSVFIDSDPRPPVI
jgi:hypothetical protein